MWGVRGRESKRERERERKREGKSGRGREGGRERKRGRVCERESEKKSNPYPHYRYLNNNDIRSAKGFGENKLTLPFFQELESKVEGICTYPFITKYDSGAQPSYDSGLTIVGGERQ